MNYRTTVAIVAAAMFGFGAAAAQAGPCSAAIARFEAAVRQSANNPNAGPVARETVGAQLGHEPTPASIARARAKARRSSARCSPAPSSLMRAVTMPAAPRRSLAPRTCTNCIDHRAMDCPRFQPSRLTVMTMIVGAAATAAFAWVASTALPPSASAAAEVTAPTFVGSESCAACHQAEARLWGASQHKRAMQHATDKTVLGDFKDVSFDDYGVQSRFFRRDGKFFVETDGPDGNLATYEVKYTFGVEPLQQYLVEFPDGRVQALSIAWDRPKAGGGQRWFHLYPNEEIKHDDVLHWTKLNQNWNFMCAECHSTGVRKSYDAARDRFATTTAEISVGLRGLSWPRLPTTLAPGARAQQSWWPFGRHDDREKGLLARFDERQGVSWYHDPRSGDARRSIGPAVLRKEVETCGRCHARRSEMSEDWVPGRSLSDTHVVLPLTEQVYWADGQARDVEEPYNYVPFRQSRMFAAGVTCGDCHDPHSGKLRVAGAGVCLQCHAPATYAGTAHSHHEAAARQPDCVACHMPARTYMMVDVRHDHSLRVPRPDQSTQLSARRMPATGVIRTSRPIGRRQRSRAGSARIARVFRPTLRPSRPRERTAPVPTSSWLR